MNTFNISEAINVGILCKYVAFRNVYVVDNKIYIDGQKSEEGVPFAPTLKLMETESLQDQEKLLKTAASIWEMLDSVEKSVIKKRLIMQTVVGVMTIIMTDDNDDSKKNIFAMAEPSLDEEGGTIVVVKFLNELPALKEGSEFLQIGEFENGEIKVYRLSADIWHIEQMLHFINNSYYRGSIAKERDCFNQNAIVCKPDTQIVLRVFRAAYLACDEKTVMSKESFTALYTMASLINKIKHSSNL